MRAAMDAHTVAITRDIISKSAPPRTADPVHLATRRIRQGRHRLGQNQRIITGAGVGCRRCERIALPSASILQGDRAIASFRGLCKTCRREASDGGCI